MVQIIADIARVVFWTGYNLSLPVGFLENKRSSSSVSSLASHSSSNELSIILGISSATILMIILSGGFTKYRFHVVGLRMFVDQKVGVVNRTIIYITAVQLQTVTFIGMDFGRL